ncbi:hypothetical protein FRC16_007880 [Serendipita sp. 398]|nr:hypothetical protein FRC16_007880 [Serendipita sp. 398]
MKALLKKNKKNKNQIADYPHHVSPEPHSVSSTSASADTQEMVLRVQSSKPYEDASELSERFFSIVKEISEAADLLSPLKSACALMIRGIQTLRTIHRNQIAWTELCEDLAYHLAQMEAHRRELEEKISIEDNGCLKALEYYFRSRCGSVTAKAVERAAKLELEDGGGAKLELEDGGGGSSSILRYGTAQAEQEEISRQRRMIENAWQVYTIAIKGSIVSKITRVEKDLVSYNQSSPKLLASRQTQDNYGTTGSDFDIARGERVELCEEGTREDILKAVRTWAADTRMQRQIFWLNDAAGTGKSTVAATIAREWLLQNRLGGRFFFSPNSKMTQTTKEFCVTIAEDIAVNQPTLAPIIRETIKELGQEQHSWFDVQLQRLVFDPLRGLETNRCIFLVVDALDNCTNIEERGELLNALIRHLPSAHHLKVLLTSRPLQDISVILRESPLVYGSDIQLLDIRNPPHSDIVIYVERKLGKVASVSSEHRGVIISNSGGLFLYAATICRMLEKSRHRSEILRVISEQGTTGSIEKRMDWLYLSILKQARVDPNADDLLISVLSMIIIAYQPISINTISIFLPDNLQVDAFVQDLVSVLKDGNPDRPIKVLHPTFREFLLSNRERANGFLVDPSSSCLTMATACITTLERMLDYDIFNLDDPNRLLARNSDVADIEQIILRQTTAAERYASAYWAHHAAESEISPELWTRVMILLSQKLLNWVELMSWRGSMVSCIEGLSHLYRFATAQRSAGSEPGSLTLRDLVAIRHAYQFVVRHQGIIINSALQTYSIALLFTPIQSPLFESYRKRYRFLQPKLITSNVIRWDNSMTIGGHSDRVEELVLSPDGTRLITVGMEGKLCLWSTETGAMIGQPFRATRVGRFLSPIGMCTFSSDGQRFAFRVRGREIHVFDSKRGRSIHPPLTWDYIGYGRATFTSTLSSVVLAGHPIRHWDIETQQEIQTPVEPTFIADDVLISPDGQRVASVGHFSDNNDRHGVVLWSLATSEYFGPYEPLDGYCTSREHRKTFISFSPDSTRLATWLADGSVQLRKGTTGEEIARFGTRAMNSDDRTYVLFCPLNQHLAYNPTANQVIVCEQVTGKKVSTLRGHESCPLSISFSSDGQRLAVASHENRVYVWAVVTGEPLKSIFVGVDQHISQCSLSSDWGVFVTITDDHQIHLYNLREGSEFGETDDASKERYTNECIPIAGPCVGNLLVIPDGRCSLRLWNTVTADSHGHLDIDDPSGVVQVAFSPEGRMIAALSARNWVYIWDSDTLVLLQKLLLLGGHSQGEGRLFFSANSSLIVACRGGVARIWDTQTMKPVFQCDNKKEGTNFMIQVYDLSCDSFHLAGVDGRQIHVWDIRSDEWGRYSTQPMLGPTGDYRNAYRGTSGAFSPVDPSLLAVNRYAQKEPWISVIELWRIRKDIQLTAKIGLSDSVSPRLSFSQDGKYVACGARCVNINTDPPRFYTGIYPPNSFINMGFQTHSFLVYRDGWIHSGFPDRPLLPIPIELRSPELDEQLFAFDECIIFISSTGEPILIDFSPLLTRARKSDSSI